MSNPERILEYLEAVQKECCDDCISREARVEPRQQVNQICRQMAQRRQVTRRKARCTLCDSTKTVTTIRSGASKSGVATSPTAVPSARAALPLRAGQAVSVEGLFNHVNRFCKALFDKHELGDGRMGAAALISELSNNGIVPSHQAGMMHTIRSLRNAYVHDHIEIGERETTLAQSASSIISEWAETNEAELWRLTRR